MSETVSLLLIAVLIVANGLFVAAEFALVAVRRGAIEERAEAGERRARTALKELHNLSFVLSAAQFGITVTSLLVGFLAEDALLPLTSPIVDLLGLPGGSTRAVAVFIAFLVSTVGQVVLGELAPKNLALARAEPTALLLAPFMRGFGIVFGPIVRVFDTAAAWVSKHLFGVELHDELLGGHSLSELSRIIAESGEKGSLSQTQTELLKRGVELSNRRVNEVMIPRPDIAWLHRDDTLDDLRVAARETGHSRFPIRGEGEDDIVGTIHIKDLLRVDGDRRATTTVAEIGTDALIVPESELIRRLLREMRGDHRTFAVVVDEYGGTAGIVTVEDMLEELVGDIEDEFDRASGLVRRTAAGRFLVQGSLRVDRCFELLGVAVPEGEYETIAGFVIERLGHIPGQGESIVHDGWELTVTRVEGARVAEVRVRRLPEAGPTDGEDTTDRDGGPR